MSETILQEIYNEIKKIREKLEQLEELIVPVEKSLKKNYKKSES